MTVPTVVLKKHNITVAATFDALHQMAASMIAGDVPGFYAEQERAERAVRLLAAVLEAYEEAVASPTLAPGEDSVRYALRWDTLAQYGEVVTLNVGSETVTVGRSDRTRGFEKALASVLDALATRTTTETEKEGA